MTDTLTQLANVAVLTFVLASMTGLGLSLTVQQVLDALGDRRAVAAGVLANFLVAPAIAVAVSRLLGLETDLTLGLLLLGTAAGAPFLPKLTQLARGDVAYSVGLMVVLMVLTVAYVPLVLVPLLDGVDVSAWDIARPLLAFMLLPLALALAARARYPDASGLAPRLNQVATTSLALGLVLALAVALPTLLEAIGTGAFAAAGLFLVACVGAGWLLGGGDPGRRVATALGTGQRNVSAALLIATTSFGDRPLVIVMVMVVSAVGMGVLLPGAAELGRQRARDGA